MIYGYARVSTDGQSVDAQVKQLKAAGAEKVYRETASGARSDRAQLRLALAQLGKGDVLTVMRLDRVDDFEVTSMTPQGLYALFARTEQP